MGRIRTLKALASPVLGAILSLVVAGSACADKPTPPGKLAVHVAISNDPSFSKKWIESAPSESFTIHRIQQIRQGQTAYIAFLVTGHKADADGRPDIVVDAVIRKPDGTLLAEMPSCCSVRYLTGSTGFVMADPAIDVRFDTTDALGMWTIEAIAKDQLAGTRATGKSQLRLSQ